LEVQVNKYKMTESQKLLSDFKFYSSYSKYLKDDERMETWEESVDRVMKMHYEKYADKITPELQSYLDFATEIYKKKRVLGSQRALQFGGVSILKHEMKMFNCLVSYADRIEFFKETMYLLLCGCGVGFSVQHKHIETLPKVGKRLQGVKTFVIEDSIEGWSDAIGVLMSSYSLQDSKFQEYYGYRIDFDYSRIRPKGSYISGGFKAPGHEGLKNSLTKIQELLDKEINGKEEIPLRSIIVYDIIMHMADAVLSGGVRRSATICLFSNDDNEMLNAKTGDWYIKNPQRGRSNNSVILIRNKTSREQFSSIMQSVKSWGEPGFVWSEDEDIIFNPCVSKDSVINTDEGLYNVENLIDKSYNPLIDGKVYKSLRGFWKTGTKDLFELTFKSGRTLKCTDNHKIMTNRGWVEAKNLEKTDKIRISNNSGFNLNLDHDSKEAKIGYLLGCFLGDGNISRNSIELKWWQNNKEIYRKQAFDILKELNMLYKPSSKEVSDSKSIYESIQSSKLFKEAVKRKIIVNNSKNLNTSAINGSHEYLLGIVAGYFDADGTVLVNKEKGNSLRITSIDIENLKSIQIILNSVGIYSKIYKNRRKGEFKSLPNGKGDKNLYLCKPIHELSISNENIKLFKDLVKIKNIDKIKSIDEILKSYVRNFNKTNFFETLESITYLGKEDVFDCTVEDLHAFECNGVYVHNCVEIGMTPYLESPNGNHHSGWQGCVSYNTKLITKEGIVEIGDAATLNQEIEIWNGVKWASVKPIQTGMNRNLYRVKFSDGSYLDCTDNHKFMVKNRFQKNFSEIETKDLINLIKESKYSLNTPKPNVFYDNKLNDEPYAYEYGFILGDGTVGQRENGKNRVPFAELYENSKDTTLPLKGKLGEVSINENNINFTRIYFNDVDCDFSSKLKYDKGLPNEIFTWSRKSMINFFAGWIDADGTKTVNGCRIYGCEDKLRDGQLLLTKLGISSSINLMSKKDVKTNMTIRKNDVWYLQISDTKDLYSNRMKLVSKPVKGKGLNQIIKSIEKIDGLYDSYCFEEPETHNGLFGNVLTKQCNLTEINGSLCNTEEEFYDACKASAIIGTLQAGYTNFKYVTNITKDIFERESLLGCSITGFMNNPKILFNPEIQKNGAKVIKETNKIISGLLGINQAARTTCVKPSGNASVLLGTGSGIHGEHSKKYFRNVQVNKEEDLGKYIKSINPKMVENSLWSNNNSDWVISFPIDAKEGSIFKKDLHGVKQLEFVKLTQQNWVEEGTNIDLCVNKHTRHNVSNTIVVDDWDEVENFIYENKQWFAGISLLGMSGDKDYAQAPFTEVIETEDIVRKYGKAALFASGLIVDGLHAFGHLWTACNALLFNSVIEESEFNSLLKKDWLRRAKQYADRYFNSDINKMTNCLKDVSLYHRWIEINRDFKSIDFQTIEIKPSYTEVDKLGAIACSGDKCEIII